MFSKSVRNMSECELKPVPMKNSGGTGKLRLMTYLVPGLPLALYQAVQYHLEACLGRDTLLLVESRWSCPPCHLPDPLTANDADVVFMCCPGYLRLLTKNNPFVALCRAAPVFEHAQNPDRLPVYFTDVVVTDTDVTLQRNPPSGKNTPPNAFLQDASYSVSSCHQHNGGTCRLEPPDDPFLTLKGARWAVNDCESLSGHLSTVVELRRRGLDMSFFSKVIWSGSHHRSLELLLSGAVDAVGIDSNTLRIWKEDNPILASRLRVLVSWGPLPVYPVVLNSRLAGAVREEITQALLDVGSTEPYGAELRRYGLHGFVPVDEMFYRKEQGIIDVLSVGAGTLSSDCGAQPMYY